MNPIYLSSTTSWNELEEMLQSDLGNDQEIQESTDSQVADLIKSKLKNICHVQESGQLSDLFHQILVENKTDESLLRNAKIVHKIFNSINENKLIEAFGTIPKIFEDLDILEDSGTPESDAKNVVKILLGTPITLNKISCDLLKAVLIHKDPLRMSALRDELQNTAQLIYDKHLSLSPTDPVNEQQKKLIEILLGNIIALYPFTEPVDNSILQIPQKIDGIWKMVTYITHSIPLSPALLGDPVTALALRPQHVPNAPPLLVFRGTPQPTANGTIPSVIADIIPGYAVGEFLYEYGGGKELIQDWITQASGEFGKVDLYGMSLGGALALLAVSRQPNEIGHVRAYSTPALLQNSLRMYEEKLHGTDHKPQVDIYWNAGDFVPLTGYGFHESWNLHKIYHSEQQNPLFAHSFLNSARKNVVVMKIDPTTDQGRLLRKIVTVFHHILSALLLPLSAALLLFAFVKTITIQTYAKISRAVRHMFQSR